MPIGFWHVFGLSVFHIRKVHIKLHMTNEHDMELLKTNKYTQRLQNGVYDDKVLLLCCVFHPVLVPLLFLWSHLENLCSRNQTRHITQWFCSQRDSPSYVCCWGLSPIQKCLALTCGGGGRFLSHFEPPGASGAMKGWGRKAMTFPFHTSSFAIIMFVRLSWSAV